MVLDQYPRASFLYTTEFLQSVTDFVTGAAAVSEQNLIRSFKYGGRKYLPPPNEMEMLLVSAFSIPHIVYQIQPLFSSNVDDDDDDDDGEEI